MKDTCTGFVAGCDVGTSVLMVFAGFVTALIFSRVLRKLPRRVVRQLSGWLNTIVSVVALFVAFAAYDDAKKSGEQQQAILEASRSALSALVDRVDKQRVLLDESLKSAHELLGTVREQQTVLESARDVTTNVLAVANEQLEFIKSTSRLSKEHLAILKEQYAEEQRLMARKPVVQVRINCQGGTTDTGGTQLIFVKSGVTQCNILVRNAGDAPLNDPIVFLFAGPETVTFAGPCQRSIEQPQNFCQMAGNLSTQHIPEYSFTRLDQAYPSTFIIPKDVNDFFIKVTVTGSNSSRFEANYGFHVVGRN